MESFNLTLARKVEETIDWEKILTKKGATQNSERYYIPIILEKIEELGAVVGSTAGAQQAIDIRDVKWENHTFSYEGKKVNGGESFRFNDTFLKDDVYYILIYASLKKVRIEQGSKLIELSSRVEGPSVTSHLEKIGILVIDMLGENGVTSDKIISLFEEALGLLKASVVNKVVSYYDFGQAFKHGISFGDFSARPRPNWCLKLPVPKGHTNTSLHPTEEEEKVWEIPPETDN
jgi:hypothetical protein